MLSHFPLPCSLFSTHTCTHSSPHTLSLFCPESWAAPHTSLSHSRSHMLSDTPVWLRWTTSCHIHQHMNICTRPQSRATPTLIPASAPVAPPHPFPSHLCASPWGWQLAGTHSITPHQRPHPRHARLPGCPAWASALKQGGPSCLPSSPGSRQPWQAAGTGEQFCSCAQICREGHTVQFVQETIAMFDMS